MAESIPFNVVGNIITKLGSLAFRDLGLIWGVNDELEKLKSTVSTIEAVLLDAEEQQSKSNSVKNWLSNLKDAFYAADDLIDEVSYEISRRQVMTKRRRKTKQVRIFFSKSNQVAFGLKMGHKIKEIREKLDAIAADRTQFHFTVRIGMRVTQDVELRERRYTHSFMRDDEVIGRDDERKTIIDHLMDTDIKEDISVIAIVGIGGLGKTTLAQFVYNDEKIRAHFELKLWVCVSEVFDVKSVVEKIIESATNKRPEPLEIDLLQSRLRREIDGKKYLLIMDDIWNEHYEQWVNLKRLLTGGAKGSKIVITTRSKQVAKTCDTTILHSLKALSEPNSWLLFQHMALKGREGLVNTDIIKIGKDIVAKLKGVPLAIRTIGRLLYYKNSEAEWSSFKENELNMVMQQENEMQSILKLSYNHLPSNLKQCFAYCALFPKDYELQKDELIRQWVAQGFVQARGINKAIEDVGHDYFMELLWRSFFQNVRIIERGNITGCKMHDFMHDLACSIVENECLLANASTWPVDKRTRHMSFDSNPNKYLELPKSLFEAKNLRTFLLQHDPDSCFGSDYNKPLLNKILSNFFHLRTLSLRIGWITKLPSSIGMLKHLRYLDLSMNYSMELLPNSITELFNLETLLLKHCSSLRELPRDTKNLINLRHLDLDGCYELTHMPKGLGGMTNLQTLNRFVLGKDNVSRLSELNDLNNLRGSLSIRGLQHCRTLDLQNNANYLKLKPGLRKLELIWSHYEDECKNDALVEDDERVLQSLQPHLNVRKLCIWGYQGVRLCNWLSSDSLVHLVSIELSYCRRLRHLPRFDQFPFLMHLNLESLTRIEYINNNDSLSSSTAIFPSLRKLVINDMPKLKGWWNGEPSTESARPSVSHPTFRCLYQLEIYDCCQLTSIPWHPPLRVLKLGGVSMQLLDMVMKTTRNLDVESSSPLFKLYYLSLSRIEDLEFLSEELFCNLTALKILEIQNCHNLQLAFFRVGQHSFDVDDDGVLWKKLATLRSLYLKGFHRLEHLPKGVQHLTTLRHLQIEYCPNLTLPEWMGNLSSLSTLTIGQCPKLTTLPEGICRLTSITQLYIHGCSNLLTLLDGMHQLTSLSSLVFYSCPNLTSLPEGIRHLHSLQSLVITNCPKLLERCKEGIGEDWPKIAHIPQLRFS